MACLFLLIQRMKKNYLLELDTVIDVHDIHIWSLSTTQIAFTVHIIRNKHSDNDDFIIYVSKELQKKFNIEHTTIQIEQKDLEDHCE